VIARPELKTLSLGDEAALREFLSPHEASSMFLLANAHAAGLVDRGEPLQGTYVAAIDSGRWMGVAAHFWNGMLVLQAPDPATREPLARAALLRSGRTLQGLAGPRDQLDGALSALDLRDRRASLDSREKLYDLELADLRVPEALASGRVVCRPPRASELDLLAAWRAEFSIESLGVSGGETLRAMSRAELARQHADGAVWVAVEAERPVSLSAFNARLPAVVQVGGVWTPHGLRGRGYARCVVAGSLLEARRGGAKRAVLFTDEENAPARAAYEALGFRVIGDYGLVVFSS
jgi:RimJ/RimL family protein N-acetyltransferase